METNIISLLSEQITDPKEMIRQGDLTIQDTDKSTVKKPEDKPKNPENKVKKPSPEDKVKKPKPEDKVKQLKPEEDKSTESDIKNPVNVAGNLIRISSIKRDWINPVLIRDLERVTKLAKIGDVVITTGQSNHDKYTINGNISLHWYGCAIDIAKFIVNGKSITLASNPELFTTLGNILVEKLKSVGYKFYDQAAGGGYLWQTMEGGNHYNHIHVSNTTNIKRIKKQTNFLNTEYYSNHKKLITAINVLHDFSTVSPSKQFKTFRKWYNDDEEAAAKYFKLVCDSILKQLKLDKTNLKLTKTDTQTLNGLKQLMQLMYTSLKTNSLQGYTITYKYYDDYINGWKSKSLNFNWNYFKN